MFALILGKDISLYAISSRAGPIAGSTCFNILKPNHTLKVRLSFR
jgi:hypothetical protein